jgi:glyoxylase-like metal-dependent hydrolase (beta-lactamase superfamily II)
VTEDLEMKRISLAAVLFALALLPLRSQGQSSGPLFDLKPVVPGVYAAIARPQYKINCNATVIVLDDGVLVVDTHSKPSAAKALMAQIKGVTDKPIKYVVNSHFHWDHFQGNEAYPAAWPQGIQIIASEATRESIEQRGIPRVKNQILSVPKEIETLRADLAKATDSSRRTTLQDNLNQAERYLAELKSMQMALPTVTFDRSLVLHGKSRTVQILWLGKAHTDGDVFVYLPNDRFVVTGDSLHGWTPFMNDSYPMDWIRTLKAVEQLDFEYAFGGHGDVFRGKAQFQAWEQYFSDLMTESAAAYSSGVSLADTVTRVSAILVPKYAAKMPPTFKDDIVANIQKAYRVVSGQVD